MIFAKGLQGENITNLLNTLGESPAPQQAVSQPEPAEKAKGKREKQEKKEVKKEVVEEPDIDMGAMNLFGGDEEY